MTTQRLITNLPNTVANTIQTLYTAPLEGNGILITAFTASNTSDINASYIVYIDNSSSEPIKPFQIVIRNKIDYGLGVVNHLIPPGFSLKIESSAANSIYFNVTGRSV